MNESPPPNEGLEEVDERYRRLSDRDSSRPSEAIRLGVLRHASELAAQARTREGSVPIEFRRPSANDSRWRVATYGGVAAAALAGLLIAPHFLTPSTAPQKLTTAAPTPAPPAPPAPPATPATPAPPRALAGGADARRATMAQGAALESASPPQLAQRATPAPSAARDMASSTFPAPAQHAARSLDAARALREAAQSGNVQRLEALLAEHIDIDARDANGRSALMLAVVHDQKEAVTSLLAAGADPNAADTSGTTPLEAAIAAARPEIAAALRRAGAR
jgi:hypothetical protein